MFIGEEPVHINAKKGSIAPLVLMPGDPLRAKYIAAHFLENAEQVCNLRNMFGYTGTYKGVRVSVIGSGMGMPSMGIYCWELYHYFDVEKIIRIGTCGGVQENLGIGDLILSTASYSESNFAYTYNNYDGHLIYASKALNEKIKETAKEENNNIHIGITCTMDVFGPYIDFERVLDRIPKELNILGEEMEAFALFHIANSFKKDAACILTVVDSKFTDKVLSSEERETSLNSMITLALDSIIK